MKLLSIEADAKTRKGTKKGYLTAILYLSPATEADDKHNLCPMASEQCKKVCLRTSGRMGMTNAVRARKRRTLMYLNRRTAFMKQLRVEIEKFIRRAKKRGLTPAIRLNGTSDQPQMALAMAKAFPHVQFYDYTKIPRPWTRTLANYHLTFSHSEDNLDDCLDALEHGINVAVVFAGNTLPKTWVLGYDVINGDESDLRFLDRKGHAGHGLVVGLKAKGEARKMEAGGFVQIAPLAVSATA